MIEMLFLLGIPYVGYVIFLIVNSIKTLVKNKDRSSTVFILISEMIFTIIGPGIGFWRFDKYGSDIPFDKHHVLSIILLVIVSSASFWLAKLTHKNGNPVLRILLSIGMLQGILLCFITSIHFILFIPMGIIYPFFGFELLSPIIALLFLLKEFNFYNRIIFDLDELLPYRAQLGFIPLPIKIMQLPALPRIAVYLTGVVMLLFLEIMIASFFGQDYDSIIKAFTHSVGFIFSKKY